MQYAAAVGIGDGVAHVHESAEQLAKLESTRAPITLAGWPLAFQARTLAAVVPI